MTESDTSKVRLTAPRVQMRWWAHHAQRALWTVGRLAERMSETRSSLVWKKVR